MNNIKQNLISRGINYVETFHSKAGRTVTKLSTKNVLPHNYSITKFQDGDHKEYHILNLRTFKGGGIFKSQKRALSRLSMLLIGTPL